MRFAIDAHAVGQHLTGNEVYVRNLINQFSLLDRQSEFLAYVCDGPAADDLPRAIHRRPVAKNPFVRLGWDLPRLVKQDRPDLLHVQYTGPVACPVPMIVSVHDVSFLEHPEFFSWPRRHQLRLTVQHTVRRAARILCPSEFSRRSILKAYNLEERRVVVMPNAVSPAFRPGNRELAAARIAAKFGITTPFLLAVGDLQPRKNHRGLLRAYSDLLGSCPHLPHHLVIVGKDTWYSPAVHKAVHEEGVADRVHITGFIEDEDLVDFYNASELLVYPSFYEGFGLPIIEAMACGRAVACSNTTAMPDVAGSAALLFDPNKTMEITMAMRDLLLNADLRLRMERLGLQRAAQFSWERTASKTLDVYYEVAGGKRPAKSLVGQPVSASTR